MIDRIFSSRTGRQTFASANKKLHILFITNSFNSMTQDLHSHLRWVEGHKVSVHVAKGGQDMIGAAQRFKPDLIICPFLTKRIPEKLWRHNQTVPCLIVHPGVEGDRGISSIDWAMMQKRREWGVTVLEAAEEMDAGAIWSTRNFKVDVGDPTLTKSTFYRRYCIPAARQAVQIAVDRYLSAEPPRLLDYNNPHVKGTLMRTMKQSDRAVCFDTMDAVEVAHRVRCADGAPGLSITVHDCKVFAFGAHVEEAGAGIDRAKPGTVLATRLGAFLVQCADDSAVWVSHGRLPGKGHVKLPAAQVLPHIASSVPQLPPSDLRVPFGHLPATFQDCWVSKRDGAAYVHWEFYNGAMNTDQCQRLTKLIRQVGDDADVDIVVLMGGRNVFSNGIDLNAIEAAVNPALETLQNINAINDVVQAVFSILHKPTLSVFRGNAGAGGVMMALAADRVIAGSDVVLNPHYKGMNLFGSEYWTFFLPSRVGAEVSRVLTEGLLPVSARTAKAINLVDDVYDASYDTTGVNGAILEYVHNWRTSTSRWFGNAADAVEVKERTRDVAWFANLAKHRAHEIAAMIENSFDVGYHITRRTFTRKLDTGVAGTPFHLCSVNSPAQRMDGTEVAKTIYGELEVIVKDLKARRGVVPGLAIVSGGLREDSEVYMGKKLRDAALLGLNGSIHRVHDDNPILLTQRLVQQIQELNRDENVHGIIVQLPLPEVVDSRAVLQAISSEKDADCMKSEVNGNILTGEADNPMHYGGVSMAPCTPRGIMELLNRYGIPLFGKRVVVVGSSRTVGLPLSLMLIRRLASVQVCNRHTPDLPAAVREADLVIACAGHRNVVKADWLRECAVVVDVGIHSLGKVTARDGTVRRKLVGDVDIAAWNMAAYVTPVPGGVGPMTVAMLMANTIALCRASLT